MNIKAVDSAYREDEPLQIEYFLLHEIRHIYQHLEIENFRKDPSKCCNSEFVKKWAEEEKSYITALDSDGDENEGYFTQDMEMDAYAYAFAVMKYKYGEIKYLYVPDAYKNGEFNNIVGVWTETFRNEML